MSIHRNEIFFVFRVDEATGAADRGLSKKLLPAGPGWLCAGHGTMSNGCANNSDSSVNSKSLAQPDGGEGHSVIARGTGNSSSEGGGPAAAG